MEIQFIDLKRQQEVLKDKIDSAVAGVLASGAYIQGPEVRELESRLGGFTGSKHVISCGSGTDALTISLLSLNIQPGDEVIVPAFSFFATAAAPLLLGVNVVFVDIEPETYFIDPNRLEEKITAKTKAIMPVPLYGQVGPMKELKAIAKKHGIPVIEDAAQSFGATYFGEKSCNLTEMGATSFYPAKPLGCYGEGGAVFTNDDSLAERARVFMNHGQQGGYNHVEVSFNGRLETLQAAILLAKFDHFIDFEVPEREKIGNMYTERLDQFEGIKNPKKPKDRTHVYAQYTVEVENRDQIRDALKEKGIPTAVHYPKPMFEQPALKKLAINSEDYPVSVRAAQSVMSLPMHPYMTEAEVDFITDSLKEAVKQG